VQRQEPGAIYRAAQNRFWTAIGVPHQHGNPAVLLGDISCLLHHSQVRWAAGEGLDPIAALLNSVALLGLMMKYQSVQKESIGAVGKSHF